MESNTWELLFRLLALYNTPLENNERKEACSVADSDLKKFEAGVTRRLSLLMTVKQWLEYTHTATEHTATGSDYWLYTRKRINALFSGLISGAAMEEVITEADPDAPLRLSKHLASEDTKSDYMLLKDVFQYMRSGLLDKGFSLLEQCGQYWRSALFRGSILSNDITMDDYLSRNIGNSNRSVWKYVVQNIIQYPNCDPYERAILSYLSGDLDNLLTVCTTWEDKVWAYYSCAVENEISSIIEEGKSTNSTPSGSFPYIVFDLVRSSEQLDSNISPKDFFHFIQEGLILDKLDDLFKVAADIICLAPNQSLSPFHSCILRYLSSLAVALMKSHLVKEDNKNISTILGAYSKTLLDANEINAAPLYLSFVEKFLYIQISSEFLLKSYADIRSVKYFTAAEKYKLDCIDICVNFFLLSVKEFDLRFLHIGSASLDINTPLRESEVIQSKSIEWISKYPLAGTELILASNYLMGAYLSSGQVKAAKSIVQTILNRFGKQNYLEDIVGPAACRKTLMALGDRTDPNVYAIVIEHVGYLALIECVHKHSKWLNLYNSYTQQLSSPDYFLCDYEPEFIEVSRENENDLKNFIFSSDELLTLSSENAESVLPGCRECSPALYSLVTKSRVEFMQRVWQLYLPTIVVCLFEVLTKTMDIIPRHKNACEELRSYILHSPPPAVKTILQRSDLRTKIAELVSQCS